MSFPLNIGVSSIDRNAVLLGLIPATAAILKHVILADLNETYSKVRIGKHLSDNFLIENGLNKVMLCRHGFSTLP
jgi:hypothetical protein